jgi:hypothetical protein
MPLRLALLTLALLLLAAGPAQADITISNVQAKPANTKAGGNSDFTLSFDLGGSESIKDLDVNLPAGLLGNPNNAAKCTQAQFASDSCPAASKVGTQTVDVTVSGIIPSSASGEVFNLVPDKPEPAQLGIKLSAPPAPTQHLKSDVTVRSSDSGLTSTIRDIPDTLSGAPIHIDSISLTLNAKSGANKPFMTNPTSCNPAVTALHAVGHSGGQANGQGSFTPTACDQLPFNPKLTAIVGKKGQTSPSTGTPLTTIIEQQPGEAASKSAKVTLLAPLAPNVGALSIVCPTAAYQSDNCPSSSRVGSASVVTPLLATPLSGPVRVVENPGDLPKVVIYLSGELNLRLVGDVHVSAAGTETTFAGIPDVPLSRFRLDFTGGPNGLTGTTEDLCKTGASLKGDFTGHNGKTSTSTVAATVKGCTTGAGKRPTGSASLRRLATKSPLLHASARRGAGAKKLRTLAIQLPGPLSFDKGYLSPGVKAAKGLKVTLSGKRSLRLRTKSTAGATTIAASVSKRALKVSAGLRKRVKKHPKVTVVLRVTEVGGRVTTLRKRVKVR